MSDHEEVERGHGDEGLSLSRRTLLRLGLLTIASATQGPVVFSPEAFAQTTRAGANLILVATRGPGARRPRRSPAGPRR